jgi:hypothetical protein
MLIQDQINISKYIQKSLAKAHSKFKETPAHINYNLNKSLNFESMLQNSFSHINIHKNISVKLVSCYYDIKSSILRVLVNLEGYVFLVPVE